MHIIDERPEQNSSDQLAGKLEFPSWKLLIDRHISFFNEVTGLETKRMKKVINDHLGVIEEIRMTIQRDIKAFHPIIAYQISSQTICKATSNISLEKTLQLLTELRLNSNEFYSIFDTSEKDHVVVDPRIQNILGMDPSVFNMKSMLGFDPQNPLYHPDDIYHSIRFGTIAYFVLAIPHLEFKAFVDFYCAKFRVSTASSNIKEIQQAEYVTLEKKAYLIEERESDSPLPMRILYRWSVYYHDEYDYKMPFFSSDPVRTPFMLEFWYLLHLQMLGISSKFIILLDARCRFDRNKAISVEINEQLRKYGIKKGEIDEGQVADCFSKTIRNKLGEIITIWEHRSRPVTISSDIEAVQEARRLGLVPIPRRVKEFIYRNISEI